MNATPPEASSEYSKGSEAPRRASGRSSGGGSGRSAEGSAKAPPKAASSESRRAGTRSSTGTAAQRKAPAPARPGWPVIAIVACAVLGALLLLLAEFTTLFQVHASNVAGPIKSVSTGSNDSYALIPIALAAGVLAFGFWRTGSRSSLLALGVLGVVVLLIALLGDLPDAHSSGLIGSSSTHYVDASSTPSAGLYLETLGAVLLLIACGCGFLLLGLPARAPSEQSPVA
jgi:hypothetical protein